MLRSLRQDGTEQAADQAPRKDDTVKNRTKEPDTRNTAAKQDTGKWGSVLQTVDLKGERSGQL